MVPFIDNLGELTQNDPGSNNHLFFTSLFRSIAAPQIGAPGCGANGAEEVGGLYLSEKKPTQVTYTYAVKWIVSFSFWVLTIRTFLNETVL